jgi:glycosyltransferase involved in cell wall biosynthesis
MIENTDYILENKIIYDMNEYAHDKQQTNTQQKNLSIISDMATIKDNNKIHILLSMGRVVDMIAQKYYRVNLCTPAKIIDDNKNSDINADYNLDYTLNMKNVQLSPQPRYTSMLSALKYPLKITKAYVKALREAEYIFVRGMLPYDGIFYLLARYYHRKPVHWIVGDPLSLLLSHHRSNWFVDTLSIAYAFVDRYVIRFGRWLTGGTLVCNGKELAKIFASARTRYVISTTISKDEYFYRDDTCKGDIIKILYVGFIRPEKGLEYLISALPKLKNGLPWRLTIVGSWDVHREYHEKLINLINELNIGGMIDWEDFVPYGPKLLDYYRQHDILVLPTLSEGTPRVLVEARANSLPIVSTNAGGIPTSVTAGVDGVLVSPKDAEAIARGIDRIVEDGDFRRKLIRNGLKTAKGMDIEHFVETISSYLRENG